MELKERILFVFVQLVFCSGISAQWSDGYVVRNEGDTIRGIILLKPDNELVKRLIFTNCAGVQSEYLPTAIQAFYINDDNRFFESREILIDSLPERFFLRCLVKGEASLYILRSGGPRFFLSLGDQFVELTNTPIDKVRDGQVYSTYKYEYIYTLKTILTARCPELLMEMDDVEFDLKDLYRIIEKYNGCAIPDIRSNSYLSKKPFRMEYELVFSANLIDPYSGNHPSFSYGGGFLFSINRPEMSRSFYASVGLRMVRLSYIGITQFGEELDVTNLIFTIPIYIRYVFDTPKVQPYLFSGYLIGFYYEYYDDYSGVRFHRSNPYGGIAIGTGLKAWRFDLGVLVSNVEVQFSLGLQLGKLH